MKRYYLCPFTRGGNPGFMVFDTKTEQVTWVNPNHVHENALLQWAVKAVTEDEWVRVALAGFPPALVEQFFADRPITTPDYTR